MLLVIKVLRSDFKIVNQNELQSINKQEKVYQSMQRKFKVKLSNVHKGVNCRTQKKTYVFLNMGQCL